MPYFSQRYRFRNRWRVWALPREVYTALARPADYPRWWPQFREARMIDDRHYWMVVRSFLPYSIAYMLTAEITDRAAGLLQARVDGDIVGRIRWQIDPGGAGSIVRFEEKVRTQVDLFSALTPFGRMAIEANHRLMMRDGLVGLNAFLAARSLAGGPADPQQWRHRF
ncbi:MAG TPA: SRPBCC family protein [Candidatus Limnocylindria bacterium]|nr:SRPBCC family protein [Candidatus Limnocylindria bacterium]